VTNSVAEALQHDHMRRAACAVQAPEHALIAGVLAQQAVRQLQAVLHDDAAISTALIPASIVTSKALTSVESTTMAA
jgi:hypothetical protein